MKKHNKKGNKENAVFFRLKREDRKGYFLQKPEKILFLLHKEFDIKKHGDNKKSKKGKFNKGREKGWKEDEPKEKIKSYTRHFLKETCCEGDQENIKQKTTRKTDERKTEKRPINMNTKFFRQSFCFEKKVKRSKKKVKKRKNSSFFF